MRTTIATTGPLLAAISLCARPVGAATEPNTLVNPLVPPSVCVNCHNPENSAPHANEAVYAPFTTWQGSMMANAARDPVFWAGIAIAHQDDQGGGGFGLPSETQLCIRCHAPRAFLEGRATAISQGELMANDLNGVECELCHRMLVTDAGMSNGAGNAQYTIDDVLQGAIVPRRGPWTYDDTDPYPPQHSWLQDAAIGTAALCGTCHDVTTPRSRVDDAGNPTGTQFNEQRTYSEWFNSALADPNDNGYRVCQDCHMPAVDDMAACAANTNVTSHPTGGRRHALAGANVFMLQVLDSLYGDGGSAEIPSAYYQETQDAIADVLATAATLELDPPDAVELGAGLQLGVTVTNETGHKLPTGYSEGRVMWLETIARYGGEVVFASGLPEQVAGDVEDPLLRTYRGVAEQFATGTQNHLLLNDHWVEDTRIPPRGLMPNAETDPVGDRYALGNDGRWPNFDAFTYEFAGAPEIVDATPGDPTDDNLEVSVRLLYVINTAEYIEFLADANMTNDAGQFVADLFTLQGGSPALVLAEQSLSIPIGGFGPVSATSTGAVDTSGSASGSGTDSGSGSVDTTATTVATDSGAGSGETSTGTGQTGESGGGCGCRTNGRSVAPPHPRVWWWLVLVPIVRRRRLVHCRPWAHDRSRS